MINELFLAAKFYAIRENAKLITKEHFMEASRNFYFKDKKLKELVEETIEQKIEVFSTPEIDKKILSETANRDKISFSIEIKKLKELIEKNGFIQQVNLVELIADKAAKFDKLYAVEGIKDELSHKVFGQELAIEVIADKLVEISYKTDKQSIKAIFFFLGPPATGKTYLAEVLADKMGEYALDVFDMSNYTSSNQGFALMGLSEGYGNAAEGKLTSFVKKHPKSICLFDEIEKAHPEILDSLLQVMARGKTKDEYTKEEIDFTDSIFIFTSNLGSELYSNNSFIKKIKDDYNNAQSMILEAIKREKYVTSSGEIPKLKPEFLSRVAQGDIILFNKLPLEAFYKIAYKSYFEYVDSFKDNFDIEVECEAVESFLYLQVLTFAPIIDARRIKSKLAIKTFDKLTDFIRKNRDLFGTENLKVEISVDKQVEKFLKQNCNDEFLHNLFRKNENVLVEDKITYKDNTILIVYKNPRVINLPKSKDFSGEDGGLIFEVPEISFDKIAGHNKVKIRLFEIIEYLKNSKKLQKHKVEAPKGMLLYGPPGTGKTMLAKAFAREAKLPFISTTGTEIVNLELMKKIYERAREYAPSIVFIDEIDAIGHRDGSYKDMIINQFLTTLNGFSDNPEEMVFTISATNLKEKIDPAILRSGRIDLHVKVDKLDKEARGFFIDRVLETPHEEDIQREKLITFTFGMSGADLEKARRESLLEMIRQKKSKLTEDIILEQINVVKYGERLTKKSLKQLVESTAFHEAGHAVVSYALMPTTNIEQITATPRDKALGFVAYNNENNTRNLTYDEIKNKICVAFAGRISQIIRYGEKEGNDSGASSDLDMAMKYLYHAIAEFGMEKDIGYINISSIENKLIDGGLRQKIEDKIHQIILELEKKTFDIVQENWANIEKVAKVLMKDELIDEKEFLNIIT